MRALVDTLQHPDPAQLAYQIVEIAGDRVYLRHGVDVRAGDVVLDVGANVGVAAAFFAQCGAAVVHSFEPVPPIFGLLRANLEHLPACVAHDYGLSSAPARLPVTYYPDAAVMSGLYADPERDRAQLRTAMLNLGLSPEDADQQLAGRHEAETFSCELRTLSSVLRDEELRSVDLLKIDVERAELDVLAGIDAADWPRIRQISMEVHEEEARTAIAAMLGERGFDVICKQDPALRGTPVQMLYATRR